MRKPPSVRQFPDTVRAPRVLVAALLAGLLVVLAGIAEGDVDAPSEPLSVSTDYELVFAIVSTSGDVGAVQFDVYYKGDSGAFAPTFDGTRGACRISVQNAFGVSNVRQDGRITVGVAGVPGFATPLKLAECKFSAMTAITPEDFYIDVVDVIDSKGAFMKNQPEIRVTAVSIDDPSAPDVGGLASKAEIAPPTAASRQPR